MSEEVDDRTFAERLEGEPNVITPSVVLEPTAGLRWFHGVLQQAWQNVYGPEVEWRDVPTEEGE